VQLTPFDWAIVAVSIFAPFIPALWLATAIGGSVVLTRQLPRLWAV